MGTTAIVDGKPKYAGVSAKKCAGPCGEMKTLSQFGRHNGFNSGVDNHCKECRRAKGRAAYAAKHKVVQAIEQPVSGEVGEEEQPAPPPSSAAQVYDVHIRPQPARPTPLPWSAVGAVSKEGCKHFWLCGDARIEAVFPDFFVEHERLTIGSGQEYQVCKHCRKVERASAVFLVPRRGRSFSIPSDIYADLAAPDAPRLDGSNRHEAVGALAASGGGEVKVSAVDDVALNEGGQHEGGDSEMATETREPSEPTVMTDMERVSLVDGPDGLGLHPATVSTSSPDGPMSSSLLQAVDQAFWEYEAAQQRYTDLTKLTRAAGRDRDKTRSEWASAVAAANGYIEGLWERGYEDEAQGLLEGSDPLAWRRVKGASQQPVLVDNR